jgi:hypothetical protein
MLSERIDPNSIAGSGRVTRYLFAALSASFIGGLYASYLVTRFRKVRCRGKHGRRFSTDAEVGSRPRVFLGVWEFVSHMAATFERVTIRQRLQEGASEKGNRYESIIFPVV